MFTICYALIAVSLLGKAMTDIAKYPFVMRQKKSELQVMMQFGTELTEAQIDSIQKHKLLNLIPKLRRRPDKIEKAEFILIVLQLMGKIQEKDVVYISEIFDALDKNEEGLPPCRVRVPPNPDDLYIIRILVVPANAG